MINFSSSKQLPKKLEHFIYIAHQRHFSKNLPHKIYPDIPWKLFGSRLKTQTNSAKILSSFTGLPQLEKISCIILPDQVSRGNSPTQKDNLFQQLSELQHVKKAHIVLNLEDPSHFSAAVSAIARYSSPFQFKKNNSPEPKITVVAFDSKQTVIKASKKELALADTIPWACSMVDHPPSDLHPQNFVSAIKSLIKGNGEVSFKEIKGKQLQSQKLGGIYSVGKAASVEPRMFIADYKPKNAKKTIALIGKGVTYDTGGLNLKISGAMSGMKADMGGAAAIMGAFQTLVQTKSKHRILGIVGLVENAIGPDSYKPDDVVTMHSGKTVEINNTDAEGRLVLADCLSYACTKYKPDLLVDAATLTGAQLIATGLKHAAVVSNDDHLEKIAIIAGKSSGDLTCALPFAPEFFQGEFKSEIADMLNSVKNRMNAQTSCAAQFIYSHIEEHNIPWLHIDLAGPSTTSTGRGSGFGVQLITDIVDTH